MPRTAMIKISASPYIYSPRALPDHAHQLSACKLSLLQSDDIYMLFFLSVGVCGTGDNCYIQIPFTGM